MTASPFRFEALGDKHRRDSFSCGDEALDRYFRTQLTQDIRRLFANCFVVLDDEDSIAGYYTLSAFSVSLEELPPDVVKKLPRYPDVPAVRIGRLGVDQRFQGRGIGGLMLINAVHRTTQDAAAAYALLVDAKNDQAVAFYEHFGFRPLTAKARALFLPLTTARNTLLQIRSH